MSPFVETGPSERQMQELEEGMREATLGDWEQRKGAEVPWELHFHALSKHIWRYFCGGFLDLPNELFCILRLDLSGKMYRFIKFIICSLRLIKTKSDEVKHFPKET